MRVLYDHQLFSLQDSGGASRYHYELMRHLSRIPDVQAEVLLGLNATAYPFRELSSGNARVTGFRGAWRPGIWRYGANEVFSNAIVPFRGRMDVYHPTLYRCLPLVRSRRIVITHQDCTHERFPKVFRYFEQVVRAKKLLFARANAIICASEASRKDLLEYYDVDAAKTCVIHHGLTHLPRSPVAAAKLQARLRREYLLYVGSRAAYKNFDALLRAFRQTGLHDSLDLLVLGGGPLTPKEAALAAELRIADKIINIARATDELLAEAYASAKLFVYPSLWEGFGFPPLEAMDAGCPVLASNTGALPEVCGNAPFYFEPEDQESFNHALLRAIDDEAARRLAIQRGREVVAQYNWEKCGDQTLVVYRQCQ